MAEAIAGRLIEERGLNVVCTSRGLSAQTGECASIGARMICAVHMLNLCGHEAALLTEADIITADIVYAMTQYHADFICGTYPQWSEKVFRMSEESDIPDPWGGDLTVYEAVFKLLCDTVSKLSPFHIAE
jgi:protein-tyrosine-phosphatase